MLLMDKAIFIVEDNQANRLIYEMALEREGAKVVFDPWGEKTIVRLNTMQNVDLIILDLTLPDKKSGFDLYKEIRAISRYAIVPVLAVSGSEDAVFQAQSLGFSGFIPKPIDIAIFPQQVVKILSGEKLWL
jgi:CheY-like chemotaxis protein